jgi:hypothetical protein
MIIEGTPGDHGRFRQFQVNVNQSFAVLKK